MERAALASPSTTPLMCVPKSLYIEMSPIVPAFAELRATTACVLPHILMRWGPATANETPPCACTRQRSRTHTWSTRCRFQYWMTWQTIHQRQWTNSNTATTDRKLQYFCPWIKIEHIWHDQILPKLKRLVRDLRRVKAARQVFNYERMVDEVATYSDSPWASGKETRKSSGSVMVKAKKYAVKRSLRRAARSQNCQQCRVVTAWTRMRDETSAGHRSVWVRFKLTRRFLKFVPQQIVPWVCFSNTSPISPLSPSLLLLAWPCDVSTLSHSTRCLLCHWARKLAVAALSIHYLHLL